MAADQPSAGGRTCWRTPGWRAALRRDLTLLMALKVGALAVLWWLFFSPPHRTPVDATAAGRRLGVERAASGALPALSSGERP